MVRTNLRYSLPAGTNKRIFLVTSAVPSEGKSTVVSNLGTVMAQAGQRTIIVDADLRRPMQHKIFGRKNAAGLTSYLVGESQNLDELLQSTDAENLWLLPSGPIPPNAAELLSSPQMTKLLQELTARADVVILDSPPLLAVTDASILASLVSGTLVVVDAGNTRVGACAEGLAVLEKAGAKILGLVLNGVRIHKRGYGRYYSYYSYYQYHYDSEHPSTKGAERKGVAALFARLTGRKHRHHSAH